MHRFIEGLRPAVCQLAGIAGGLLALLAAGPVLAAGSAPVASAPGIEAWTTLAMFAALVVMACIVVRNAHAPAARQAGAEVPVEAARLESP